MKYYVRSRFYDNGKIETKMFLESEAFDMDRTNKETNNYDEYWDEFPTWEQAQEFIEESKTA